MFNEKIYIRTDAEPVMISKDIGVIETTCLPIGEQKRLSSLYENMFVNMIRQIEIIRSTIDLEYNGMILHIYKNIRYGDTVFLLKCAVTWQIFIALTASDGKYRFKVLNNDLKHFIKLADFARLGLI